LHWTSEVKRTECRQNLHAIVGCASINQSAKCSTTCILSQKAHDHSVEHQETNLRMWQMEQQHTHQQVHLVVVKEEVVVEEELEGEEEEEDADVVEDSECVVAPTTLPTSMTLTTVTV
jgi:hypothetical protein